MTTRQALDTWMAKSGRLLDELSPTQREALDKLIAESPPVITHPARVAQ
ncbi:MAG TPA: hypothetical protein VFN75_10625 [Pseudonocardiaceae bacterium]|nr:hypothetical protein [Pseudonocardiaceae bacterium]